MDAAEREMVYEDSIGRIYWDGKGKCLEAKAKARSGVGQEYRTSLLEVVELVRRKGAGKMLADAAHLEKMSNEDIVWLEKGLIPGLVKAGVKRVAMVPPKQMAADRNVEKVALAMDKSSGGVERRFFSDVEQARKWLSLQ